LSAEFSDALGIHWARLADSLSELPGIEQRISAEAQTPEKRKVGIDERECTVDGHVRRGVGKHILDVLDLASQTVGELGSVAAGDKKLGLSEHRFANFNLASVPLRVDHPDPRSGNCDVIDVRFGTRQTPVMQQNDVLGDVTAERLGDPLLSDSAPFPASLVSWFISKSENRATE
jgi:hypothetical protein